MPFADRPVGDPQGLRQSVADCGVAHFEVPATILHSVIPAVPPAAVLRKCVGLTLAECRVALLLSDGHSPKEIANTVGATDNTVRSQIKSIFSKTGVRRQSDLVRLPLTTRAGHAVGPNPRVPGAGFCHG